MNSFISKRRAAFTLIELLVVIAVIGLLSSISIPVVIGIIKEAHRTTDISNMGQIMEMTLTDRLQNRQTWSFPKNNTNFNINSGQQPLIGGSPSHASGIDVSNVILYTLAARHTIPPDMFNSQELDEGIFGIANHTRSKESDWTVEQIRTWTNPNGTDLSSTAMPYAIDWSAPKSSTSARITIGMRDPLVYDSIPVIHADGHAGTIEYDEVNQTAINTNITPVAADGTALDGLTLDDIYTETGDIVGNGTDPAPSRHLWIGRGDLIRADLKQ